MNRDGMKITGRLEIVLRDKHGHVKQREVHENLIVDQGFDLINTLVRTGTGNFTDTLGVVWNDPDAAIAALGAADTDFPGPPTNQDFKTGVAVTIAKIDDKTWKLTAAWAAGEPTPGGSGWPIPIRGVGIYWNNAANTLFAGKVRSPMNKANTDELEVNYTIAMS